MHGMAAASGGRTLRSDPISEPRYQTVFVLITRSEWILTTCSDVQIYTRMRLRKTGWHGGNARHGKTGQMTRPNLMALANKPNISDASCCLPCLASRVLMRVTIMPKHHRRPATKVAHSFMMSLVTIN